MLVGRLYRAGFVRRLVACCLFLSALASQGCGSGSPRSGEAPLDEWAAGPVRWLLQPDERRALRQLRTKHEAVQFLREFWARRNPDPAEPGNRFAEVFFRRVEAADQLYREGDKRGALTDRGRALILLGPPVHMRFFQQPALTPGLRGDRGSRRATREVTVEEWSFQPEDLDASLRQQMPAESAAGVVLRFVSQRDGAKLVEGESFLVMAARLAVRRTGEAADGGDEQW